MMTVGNASIEKEGRGSLVEGVHSVQTCTFVCSVFRQNVVEPSGIGTYDTAHTS